MTYPTFTTRADLEAWSDTIARRAAVSATIATRREPDKVMSICREAIEQIKRVMIAHIHLED